jgi:hypothetical protein
MSKKGGFFSKILTSLTGIQNDTEEATTSTTTTIENETIAESSYDTKRKRTETATITVRNYLGEYVPPLKKSRRTLIIEEELKHSEHLRKLETCILEWKRSLKLGYEYDFLDNRWSSSENGGDCSPYVTLPPIEKNTSVQVMYAIFVI